MNDSLESIIQSGRSEAVPQPEPQAEQPTQAPEQETAQEQPEAEGKEGVRTVPHEALHAEKQKTKRYTEEVSSLRQEIEERDRAWERRIAQLMEAQRAPQQPQQAPDFLENFGGAVQHEVAPHLTQLEQRLQAVAKDNAITRFSEDEVNEAEQAFIRAMESRQLDPADYSKVVNSHNRYAAAVQWARRQKASAEIGDDPAAYKEKLRQELLAELQQQGQQPTQGHQSGSVFPSNLASARNVGSRSGPAWGGPPPIADILNRNRPPS